MTAQRLVRGSKVRFIATLAALVFITGLLVLVHQQQTQMRNVKKNYEMCVQQQESLSTQLQVIVDYKTRLEKSLQSEKTEHKQTRAELEGRINDEKTRRDKTSVEANLRFTSLQQHYKLLQRKHDDLKEKLDKYQQQYMEETDKLQAKVKELQEQLKQSEKNKEKSLEHLKSLYLQLDNDKKRLTEELKKSQSDHAKWENDLNHMEKINHQLERKVENLESERNKNIHQKVEGAQSEKENILVGETIPVPPKIAKQVEMKNLDDTAADDKQLEKQPQVDAPNVGREAEQQGPVISQNAVLQKPSSFSKSTPKTSSTASNAQVEVAQPLVLPTISPNSSRAEANPAEDDSKKVLRPPNMVVPKKLPAGVVPVPQQDLHRNEEQAQAEKTDDKNNIPDEIHMALPNRYRHNIIESEIENEINKEAKGENKPNLQNAPELNMGLDLNVQDNAANEVLDGKIPVQEDPLHLMDPDVALLENNPLKEAENVRDSVVQLIKSKNKKQHHGDGVKNAEAGGGRGAAYDADADYEGQKDLQLDEVEPEGEEDDEGDGYEDHLAARQRDPAVRN